MPKRVLLVDDEADIRTIAELCLGELGGYDVMVAASGAEAVELARVTTPDVIVVDMMMPGMDGPTTLAALRALPALTHTPAVFLTARSTPPDAKAHGACGVIRKPFDPMALADQLRAMTE